MNEKTVKKLNRLAVVKNFSPKALKKLWQSTPKHLKPEFRESMKRELELTR